MTAVDTRVGLSACLLAAFAIAVRGPGAGAVGVLILAAVVGLMLPSGVESAGLNRAAVALAGMAAFAVVATLPQALFVPVWKWGVISAIAAAVAEELLFRRALIAQLTKWGPGTAVVVSAIAFGLVHVHTYGWSVLPLDIAAGMIFGWQRWATGSWLVPAATHVFANLVQMRG